MEIIYCPRGLQDEAAASGVARGISPFENYAGTWRSQTCLETLHGSPKQTVICREAICFVFTPSWTYLSSSNFQNQTWYLDQRVLHAFIPLNFNSVAPTFPSWSTYVKPAFPFTLDPCFVHQTSFTEGLCSDQGGSVTLHFEEVPIADRKVQRGKASVSDLSRCIATSTHHLRRLFGLTQARYPEKQETTHSHDRTNHALPQIGHVRKPYPRPTSSPTPTWS